MTATALHATGELDQDAERVFLFLSNLRNHWRLSPQFVELDHLDGDGEGAQVRIRGPLGLGRSAHTRIHEAIEPSLLRGGLLRGGLLRGAAVVGRSTVGAIRWEIEPRGQGSRVTLSAEVVRASLLDRAILALGGRRYLARGLRDAVARLGQLA